MSNSENRSHLSDGVSRPRRATGGAVGRRTLLTLKLMAARMVSTLRRKIIGPRVRAVLTEGYNGAILISPDDLFIGRRLAWRGEYNRPQVERLVSLARGKRALIVGTHVGTILIPVAKVAKWVVGIEADPDNHELLQWNLLLNGITNATVHHMAASDRSGSLNFLIGRVNTGGSKVDQGVERVPAFFYDSPRSVAIEANTLDTALKGECFDLILMDIEGSEYRALTGMQEILSHAQTLIVEILPNCIDNIAGVTTEEFLAAVPGTFTHASYLGRTHSRIFSREEFSELTAEIWRDHYLDGCDVAFTSMPGMVAE